jgi:PAS domain S-box-containing protein
MTAGVDLTLLYQSILVVGTALALVVAVVAWKNRPNTGARYLAMTAVGVAFWSFPTFLQSITASLALDLFFARLTYLGVVLTIPSWFMLAVEYTGRDELRTWPVRAVVWGGAIGMLALVWSVYLVPHDLHYTGITVAPDSFSGFHVDHGIGFYLWVVFAYVLTIGSLGMFVDWFRRSTELYRRQAAMVIVAGVAPLIGNALYVTDVVAIDPTPFGFAVASAALAFGVFEFRLTEVAPVARESLMRNIQDGVIVVDDQGRIREVNPAARSLLDLEDDVVGTQANAAFDGRLGEVASALDDADQQTLVSIPQDDGVRHVDVRVWAQSDTRDRALGHVLYLRDVTAERRRERELERQNEQLDRFASVVSHDLRNPLNVAEGYVASARETGDVDALADVEDAHERMRDIIDDVLDLARTGRTVTDVEPVDLARAAEQAWAAVDTGDAELVVSGDVTVQADESRLQQLLENLIRNAVQHGGDGVTVTVGPHENGFYVADDGPGIPPDEREAVLEDGYTTHEDGTGFGLSIVTSIADAHGWTITVGESDAGGARFTFSGTDRDGMDQPMGETAN